MWGSIAGLEQHEVNQIMERALAAGINFIDTADVYSIGQSEKLLGQSLKDLGIHRKDVVIATKVHGPMGAGPNDKGSSRGHIMDSIEQSLERLQTNYIDLYQINGHRKSGVSGKRVSVRVDLGGRRIIKKKKKK